MAPRSGPPRRKGDIAFNIVVGLIVIMAAILVGGLLSNLLQQQ